MRTADTDLRKRARWVTTAFYFISGIISASWSSRIPDVQGRLQLDDAQWGTVLFFLPVGLVVSFTVSGWLVARFGSQKMAVAGCLVSALLLALIGITNTAVQLMAALFGFGFIRTIVNIALNTKSVEVQQLYRQPIVSSFHGLWSLACFVAAAMGTVMIVYHIKPAVHFILIALICIPIIFLLREKKSTIHKAPEKRPIFVKPDSYLFHLGLIAFFCLICEGAMFDWSVTYFEKVVHTDKSATTAGYTAFITAMAAGRLVGDNVIAKWGAFSVLRFNGILMAAGFALAALLPFLLPAAVGFLLVGLGDSIIVPIVYILTAKSKKIQGSYAIASVTLIGYFGFLTGPLLIGHLSKAIGLQWAFALAAIFSLCITFLTIKIKNTFDVQ